MTDVRSYYNEYWRDAVGDVPPSHRKWHEQRIHNLFEALAATPANSMALKEFNRILKPGGRLIITTPFHGLVKNLVLTFYGYDKHYDPLGPHIGFFTRNSLNQCLTNSGFKVLTWSGVGRRWPVWMSHFVVAEKCDNR